MREISNLKVCLYFTHLPPNNEFSEGKLTIDVAVYLIEKSMVSPLMFRKVSTLLP